MPIDLFKKAVEIQINESLKTIEELENIPNPIWIEPFPLSGTSSVPLTYSVSGKQVKKSGVYKIYHWDNLEVPMAIGQGGISDRLNRHRLVFRNEGVAMVYKGGTSSSCATASKMYQYDSNLDNWYFSWCSLPRNIISSYEKVLIKELKPKLNLAYMAGL